MQLRKKVSTELADCLQEFERIEFLEWNRVEYRPKLGRVDQKANNADSVRWITRKIAAMIVRMLTKAVV